MSKAVWEMQRRPGGYLALADGTVFYGQPMGAPRDTVGEAVFNTGMTGYQEILSDPSYAGQFVCLTAPEIGNYGVNREDMESARYFANGLLVHRINQPSNWRSEKTLQQSLIEHDIPALSGLDTRALTILLRDRGAQKSFLCASGLVPVEEGIERARNWEGIDGQDYASRVTTGEPYAWTRSAAATGPRVTVYDFGVKWSILRMLEEAGFVVSVTPAATPAADVLATKPDGVFFSNGPGDPAALPYAVETVREMLGKVPVMGICLGHQLLSLACGGATYKLAFGHHGCNHPVKELATGRTLVTSQNHNFAVVADSIPSGRAEITHVSLNDGSVEGMRLRDVPAFSVQFHPEAGPGPHDAVPAFRQFREMIG